MNEPQSMGARGDNSVGLKGKEALFVLPAFFIYVFSSSRLFFGVIIMLAALCKAKQERKQKPLAEPRHRSRAGSVTEAKRINKYTKRE